VNALEQDSRARIALAIFALAVGSFAIGTTEFVTMGVLPEISQGLGVDEPTAAHGITSYALGVVVGVPVLTILGARLPRKAFLIGLMAAYSLFNLLTAFVDTYEVFVVVRFLDGFPHGAYFGLASLAAANMVPPIRRGRAVASVIMGLSVANIVGVPSASWLGQHLGWRASYVACALLAAVAAVMVAFFLKRQPVTHEGRGSGAAKRFFSSAQVWITLAAGSIGFGGMFAIYSYVATTVTSISGLSSSVVPIFLLAFGLGMTLGTWIGGELAAWSVYKSLLFASMGTVCVMFLFWVSSPYGWFAIVGLFGVSTVSSITVTNLQLRLMDVAGDATTLGAAMSHAVLNIGNAVGAAAGGAVIAAGYSYRAPALVAVGLAFIGLLIISASGLLERKTGNRGTAAVAADEARAARAAAAEAESAGAAVGDVDTSDTSAGAHIH
jgi:DHA1 family inner membrane transport protein